jgi:pyruvate dehydrogenase E1 component alpha subunit
MTPEPDILISLYTTMLKIRRTEEKLAELLSISGEIICPVHLYLGEEAVATGVCANLKDSDYVFSTHRSHGHFLAKGGNLKKMMAEIYGRATGSSKGRGGSMHLAEPEKGLPGSSAIVAGSIPLAAGAAYASKLKRNNSVAVTFFGDGAADEGVLYETMNLAVLNKLPVIFICENNLYSTHLSIKNCLGDTDIRKKAESFGMPAYRIDGNNVIEVYETASQAVSRARHGEGPTFIEALTYRWLGHVGPNDDIDKGLRSQEELESWKKRCPVKQIETLLMNSGILSSSALQDMKISISGEIEEAVKFAKESPYPAKNELLLNVYKGKKN